MAIKSASSGPILTTVSLKNIICSFSGHPRICGSCELHKEECSSSVCQPTHRPGCRRADPQAAESHCRSCGQILASPEIRCTQSCGTLCTARRGADTRRAVRFRPAIREIETGIRNGKVYNSGEYRVDDGSARLLRLVVPPNTNEGSLSHSSFLLSWGLVNSRNETSPVRQSHSSQPTVTTH